MLVIASTAYAGKVELTTYYPAPYGEYKDVSVTDSTNLQGPLTASGTASFTNGITVTGGTPSISPSLTVGGTVTASSFLYSSDMRLKENIVPVTGSLEKIGRLNGVNFVFKSAPGEKHLGLLAQEVESVIPEVVRTQADGMKAVDYASLTALLIEGMKEQQREIELLREKLARVEATVGSGN
jgi:hypothetical protein